MKDEGRAQRSSPRRSLRPCPELPWAADSLLHRRDALEDHAADEDEREKRGDPEGAADLAGLVGAIRPEGDEEGGRTDATDEEADRGDAQHDAGEFGVHGGDTIRS